MQLLHNISNTLLIVSLIYLLCALLGFLYSFIKNISRPKYYKRTFVRFMLFPSNLIKKINLSKWIFTPLLVFIISLIVLEGYRYINTNDNATEYLKSPYTKSQMYVHATSQYNKTYKLPADVSKNKYNEWDSEYLIYCVYFPNGGYLNFHNESIPADFGVSYEVVDNDGNDWSILLTTDIVPNTTTHKPVPFIFILSIITSIILSLYWFNFK